MCEKNVSLCCLSCPHTKVTDNYMLCIKDNTKICDPTTCDYIMDLLIFPYYEIETPLLLEENE